MVRTYVVNDAADPFDGTIGASDMLVLETMNGSTLVDTQQSISESGGTVSLNFEQNGGGDVPILFQGTAVTLDCTPTATVALTAGTDTAPQANYVYITESGGTATLAASTGGWPTAEDFAPVATVLVQSAASVALHGVLKHHAWTDHVKNSKQTGHMGHVNKKLRALEASWVSGCAANNLTISSPDAYFTVDAGVVYQLHEHSQPALDMSTDGAYLVNDPTTAYKYVETFDDITQDASGGAINNRWFPLVVWGVVSENDGDCNIMINLPTGTYVNESLAQNDASNYASYAIPTDFRGTGFLIAKYVVQGKDSGTWVQSQLTDLRGLFPAVSPGAGSAVSDHGGLSGLGDDDHPQYALLTGATFSGAVYQTAESDTSTLTAGYYTQKSRVGPAIVQDNDWLGFVAFGGYDGSTYSYGARITAVVDGTPGASDMPAELIFSTRASGGAGPVDRWRVAPAGHLEPLGSSLDFGGSGDEVRDGYFSGAVNVPQIAFPATQAPSSDANTLDDYEEGSWTPTLKFGGASTGITYSVQNGNYVKIGRLVRASFRVALSSVGTATGTAEFGGLPFTTESGSEKQGGGIVGYGAGMTGLTSAIVLLPSSGGTTINIRHWSAFGAGSLQDTNFTASSNIYGVVVYYATD